MVRLPRFELGTNGLKGRCSTVELQSRCKELSQYGTPEPKVKTTSKKIFRASLKSYNIIMPRKVKKSKTRNSTRRKIKTEFQDRLGGKCQICSYSKCQSALHFHHKDASQKKFTISDAVKRKSFTTNEINEEMRVSLR
jgi:hypothetical protein